MADYDVGVLGLSSPPPSSVLTPYRPAVSVRNNGIHDALASGTLRIYTAGLLIFTTELYSATIPPGETRNALGTDYWTPPAEGKYLVIADVVCPLDQVESNNHLSPTTVMVLGGPPPPPTTVAPHGSQHEDGGADEVNIDGLHGRLADAQPALAHKASHMVGGSDAISVEGLPGQLLEAQGIRDHHESHEDHGSDELNVEGLRGKLYNVQKPDVHDNSAHDPNYSINKHGAVDHNADVEAVSRKGAANGYAGLGANGYVPANQLGLYVQGVVDTDALRKDQSYGPAHALAHKTSHENGGSDELSVSGLSGLLADPQTPNFFAGIHGSEVLHGNEPIRTLLSTLLSGVPALAGFIIESYGTISVSAQPAGVLNLSFISGVNTLCTCSIPAASAYSSNFRIKAYIWNESNEWRGYLFFQQQTPHISQPATSMALIAAGTPTDTTIALKAQFSNGVALTTLTQIAARMHENTGH